MDSTIQNESETAQSTTVDSSDANYPLILALICVLVFANSFFGVFVFDEYSSITSNEGIKHFWPMDWLTKYPNMSRPVISFTLMLNYAIDGPHCFSYHLLNLAIHLAATLTLYGLLRRTFIRLRNDFALYAQPLAFAIALLWSIHPLQTSSVTYIIQRCESLMGLFFLLTVYCVNRAATGPRAMLWTGLAVLSCALGMGTKEVMATAPLLTLLYDRAFLSGSFKAALRARPILYMGLFYTLGILAICVFAAAGSSVSAGFGNAKVTPWHYFLTQCKVIPYYLRLVFWPNVLSVDHDWAFVKSINDVWLPMSLLTIVGVATFIGIVLNRGWAFLGAWFFLILAPSSSFMPINDPVFEHRMYLPLAAVIAATVLEVFSIVLKAHPARRLALVSPLLFCAGILALPLSARTFLRNHDYSSDVRIWRKAAELYPHSARICNNLGNALACEAAARGVPAESAACKAEHEEAVKWFEQAVANDPKYTDALFNLGVEYSILKLNDKSEYYYKRLFEVNTDYPNAHYNLGEVLKVSRRYKDAIEQYGLELKRDPNRADVKEGLASALRLAGEDDSE